MEVRRYKDSQFTKYTFSNGHSVHLKDDEVEELMKEALSKPLAPKIIIDGTEYLLTYILDAVYEQHGRRITLTDD